MTLVLQYHLKRGTTCRRMHPRKCMRRLHSAVQFILARSHDASPCTSAQMLTTRQAGPSFSRNGETKRGSEAHSRQCRQTVRACIKKQVDEDRNTHPRIPASHGLGQSARRRLTVSTTGLQRHCRTCPPPPRRSRGRS